jgi:hypothetical protein
MQIPHQGLCRMSMHVIPLPDRFLHQVRNQGRDDLGQAVEHHTARGGEPCRDVLRGARPGEGLILASYCPFSRSGPYREYGPVYVLAEPSGETPDLSRVPLPVGEPEDYLGDQFVLRAYNSDERIIGGSLSSPERCESDLAHLFGELGADFVLIRYAVHGCYSMRFEPDQASVRQDTEMDRGAGQGKGE